MGTDIVFADDPPMAASNEEAAPWTILVVDDDIEVQAVTRLALGNLHFKGRPLKLIGALSSGDAEAILRNTGDIAVVLLDVVMETEDAGLRLVRTIREDIGNRAVRIILRTGQPGQAPEDDVVLAYDINDYKAKTELTSQKLFTTVIAALRAYADIVALETSRSGLQRIVQSTDRLFTLRSLPSFAAGVLAELAAFPRVGSDAVLCAILRAGPGTSPGAEKRGDVPDVFTVLAATGRHAGLAGMSGRALPAPLAARVADTMGRRSNLYAPHAATLHIPVPGCMTVVVALDTDGPLDDVDRGLVEVFAAKIAVGFANLSLYEQLREANETLEARVAERTRALEAANTELERLATVDPLTGVWNRRHFLEFAAGELARARRHGRALSVFLLDLDHFKTVNDRFGHAAGDVVLCTTVARARGALRTSDQIARFGGEEFVALLPETDIAGARIVAERVRAAIAAGPIAVEDHGISITASLGVATWTTDEASIEHTLRRADAALYEAKQDGRNRVCLARD